MIAGIATGLSAAFCQSLTYLSARHYVQRRITSEGRQGASLEMLVLAHVLMGLLSIVLLPFVWPSGGVPFQEVADPCWKMCLLYVLGQVGTMIALRHGEPSRIAPLLGFKIVVLAGIASFVEQPHVAGTAAAAKGLNSLQWLAVGLSVLAAIFLSRSGTRMRASSLLGVIMACICYSFADWNITATCKVIESHQVPALQASLATVALCHGLCGIAAALFLPIWGSRKRRDWQDATPYAIEWFVAMLFLYWCFAMVGPLLGNILQSTRGLISILMGALLIHWGHHHIEPHTPRRVLAQRVAAGILMSLAISLYARGNYLK
jgi:drug/metabolite transporter (DMT)-like permease